MIHSNTALTGEPAPADALALLEEGSRLNPGPWVNHSRHVGVAARAIAAACPPLNPDLAETLGLLHDIGRRFGKTGMRHALDGYRFLIDIGAVRCARVALTHSYPLQDMSAVSSAWCGSSEEFEDVRKVIEQTVYDDYDRLIQLCDCLALPTGVVLMEKRLVDVVLRHGCNPYTVPRWKVCYAIKDDFEARCGGSLYRLFPDIAATTFE